jgi:hypothetical protein
MESRPEALKKPIALSCFLALVAHALCMALRFASLVTRREGELWGKLQLACVQGSDLLEVLASSLLPHGIFTTGKEQVIACL